MSVVTDRFDFVQHPLPHYVWRAEGARAVFTLRDQGVSDAPWNSLNLGLHTGDERAMVGENRRRAAAVAAVERHDVRTVLQVHGSSVWVDGDGQEAAPWTAEPPQVEADALVTAHGSGHSLAVMVADCPPVAIVTAAGVSAVHAGWRSLVGGIFERVAERLDLDGAVAAIGPCIGPCCFEVGVEVANQFHVDDVYGPVVEGERPHVNLRAAITRRLEALGVARVDVLKVCTSCDERCFSHRRDLGRTGRQALLLAPRAN